jgi:uncharacterized protein
MAKAMKEKGWLEYKYAPTGEPIRFPVGTIHGAKDGPTLAVLGGMHGSEFCGIEAAIRLYNEVDPDALSGTLMVGMIYNFPAFYNNMGFVVPQDGKNPGRTFPGDPNGTYSEVMAYHFMEDFLRKADYYCELHGGDIPEALVPFNVAPVTGNEAVDKISYEMAYAYNLRVLVQRKYDPAVNPPHTGYALMPTLGTPAILCESGQQGILNLEDAERHLVGLRNVMRHFGMMPGPIVNTVKRLFSAEHAAMRSELMGMWYPAVGLGDWVSKDQIVGCLRDYFGDHLADVKAIFDGHVTVVRTSPSVAVGNVLMELDRVTSREE